MENYLSGRSPDADPPVGNEPKPFRSLVPSGGDGLPLGASPTNEAVKTLHDEPGGPKVEVVSVDGKVTRIVIHLENDKTLNLHCEY
ncbi:MAG: hypothetical protein VCA36_05035 [Opitutales bacterium]